MKTARAVLIAGSFCLLDCHQGQSVGASAVFHYSRRGGGPDQGNHRFRYISYTSEKARIDVFIVSLNVYSFLLTLTFVFFVNLYFKSIPLFQGFQFIMHPELMFVPEVKVLYNSILSDENSSVNLKIQVLKNLQTYLQEEDSRMQEADRECEFNSSSSRPLLSMHMQ